MQDGEKCAKEYNYVRVGRMLWISVGFMNTCLWSVDHMYCTWNIVVNVLRIEYTDFNSVEGE
jgi:hypothetical protein